AVLPDGRTITTDGLTLLGRSPAGRTGEQVVGALALEDAAVSKTHLAIRLADGQAWATDRASTNGSVLVRGGEHEALTAWEEVALARGDPLLLGTSMLRLEGAGAGTPACQDRSGACRCAWGSGTVTTMRTSVNLLLRCRDEA